MDYKNIMKKLSSTLMLLKNSQETITQKMKSMIPENLTNVSRWYTVPGGTAGSGAGKGGGAGGSIRESGGGLGRFGAAQEEGYFFQKQKEQLKRLKDKLTKSKTNEIKQKADK